MALLPVLLSDLLDEVNNRPLYDQHFGLGLNPGLDILPRLSQVPLYSGYLRPWRHLATGDSGVSAVESTKNDFKVSLDVQQFKPEEVSVKLQGDYLVVEGKHEERKDQHGFISRQFQRRYKLPENVELDKIKSTLSSDGVLTLVAPKKIESPAGEKTIPIEKTNKPAIKQQAKAEGKQEKMET